MSDQPELMFGVDSAEYLMCVNPNPRPCLNAKERHPIPRSRALTYQDRPGRFYCRGCGRELREYQNSEATQ